MSCAGCDPQEVRNHSGYGQLANGGFLLQFYV